MMHDLVDTVQRLLAVRVELKLGPLKVRQDRLSALDWRNVGTISEFAAELFHQSRDSRQCPAKAMEMKRIAVILREVARDLRRSSSLPGMDDLIARYVSGDVDLMTVLAITGWDWDRLSKECHSRNLPHTPVSTVAPGDWLVDILDKRREGLSALIQRRDV